MCIYLHMFHLWILYIFLSMLLLLFKPITPTLSHRIVPLTFAGIRTRWYPCLDVSACVMNCVWGRACMCEELGHVRVLAFVRNCCMFVCFRVRNCGVSVCLCAWGIVRVCVVAWCIRDVFVSSCVRNCACLYVCVCVRNYACLRVCEELCVFVCLRVCEELCCNRVWRIVRVRVFASDRICGIFVFPCVKNCGEYLCVRVWGIVRVSVLTCCIVAYSYIFVCVE